MHVSRPVADRAARFPWTASTPLGFVRFIGMSEVLGASGLILPERTGIQRWLTPLAAAGLALVMLLAVGLHLRRPEMLPTAANFALATLALFVAYGRMTFVSA